MLQVVTKPLERPSWWQRFVLRINLGQMLSGSTPHADKAHRKRVEIHEMGHAIAGEALFHPITVISTRQKENYGGFVQRSIPKLKRSQTQWFLENILVAIGGITSEMWALKKSQKADKTTIDNHALQTHYRDRIWGALGDLGNIQQSLWQLKKKLGHKKIKLEAFKQFNPEGFFQERGRIHRRMAIGIQSMHDYLYLNAMVQNMVDSCEHPIVNAATKAMKKLLNVVGPKQMKRWCKMLSEHSGWEGRNFSKTFRRDLPGRQQQKMLRIIGKYFKQAKPYLNKKL